MGKTKTVVHIHPIGLLITGILLAPFVILISAALGIEKAVNDYARSSTKTMSTFVTMSQFKFNYLGNAVCNIFKK